ncbi:Protein of unknown function [Bacillus wiedmannii]|nr:Protein of unknown function [Bacillus wiedmannii]
MECAQNTVYKITQLISEAKEKSYE